MTIKFHWPLPKKPTGLEKEWEKISKNHFETLLNFLKEKIEAVISTDKKRKCSVKWMDYSFRLGNPLGIQPENFGLYDFTFDGKTEIVYFTLNFRLPFGSKIIKEIKNNTFLIGKKPWFISTKTFSISEASKTTYRVYIRAALGINLPLVNKKHLPSPDKCNHEFRLIDTGTYDWKLLWQCKRCGFLTFCECFKKALEIDPPPPKGTPVKRFGKELPLKYPGNVFYPDACEVCRGVPSTAYFMHPMYARSQFEVRYGAYIHKKMIELGLDPFSKEDEAIASNIVRKEVGHKNIGENWFHENELYKIISNIFKGFEVIHHYRNKKILENLELDIYIPKLKLGIEYNGKQHYEPIKHFGGLEGLEKTQERDRKKRSLCQKNGIELEIFSYKEEITENSVRKKLEKYIEKWKKVE